MFYLIFSTKINTTFEYLSHHKYIITIINPKQIPKDILLLEKYSIYSLIYPLNSLIFY